MKLSLPPGVLAQNKGGVKIINITRNSFLADKAGIADSLWPRLKGLLGKESLGPGEGLVIMPCGSIHTFFMRFPIDVAFIDRNQRVIRLYPSLPPWRLSGVFLNSALCLELPSGTLLSTHTQEGDEIGFS